jgi:NAD-dependent SIR2 family protein deacetylase
MTERVLFLGAGASAHFGLPMTSGILAEIVERIENEKLFGPQGDRRQRLGHILAELLPGLDSWRNKDHGEKTWKDTLPWITEVLSLIDHLMAYENSMSGQLRVQDLPQARRLLEQAISEVLARGNGSMLSDVPDRTREDDELARRRYPHLFERQLSQHEDLRRLAHWVVNEPGGCSVITTNYDMLLDSEIFPLMNGYEEIWKNIDFGFSPREGNQDTIYAPPAKPKVSLYKLHGSLNWLRCARCGRIYVNPSGQIAYLAFEDEITQANSCHCGYAPLQHVMVTPSFLRTVHDPNLYQIWHNALEALRRARQWFIIGYSLPQEDLAIRSLLLRAYHGGASKSEIHVFVADERSRPSYELQFPGCRYYTTKLEGFLKTHVAGSLGT